MSRDVRQKVKDDPKTNTWMCPPCLSKLVASPPKKIALPDDVQDSAGKMKSETKQSLRVIQWNAEAISTKMYKVD